MPDEAKKIGIVVSTPEDATHSDFGFGPRYSRSLLKAIKALNIEAVPVQAVTKLNLNKNLKEILNGEIILHGMLFCSYTPAHKQVAEMLNESGFPYMFLDMARAEPGVNGVYIDQFDAARMSTARLIETGHKKIACIGVVDESEWFEERHKGYFRALSDAGIKVSGDLVFRLSEPGEAGGYMAAQKLIASVEMPDGLFCASIRIAKGVIKALLAAGKKIPQDVAVTSVDDLGDPNFCEVPLTTVDYDIDRLPLAALEALLRMKNEKRAEAVQVRLEGKILIRKSA